MTDPLRDLDEPKRPENEDDDGPSMAPENHKTPRPAAPSDDDDDIFDNLARFAEDHTADLDGPPIRAAYPVRKPKRTEWFRTHPSPDMTIQMVTYTADDGTMYCVEKAAREAFDEQLVPTQIVICCTHNGEILVWPVKLPSEQGGPTGWFQSAWTASVMARKGWVKMYSDRKQGQYKILEAPNGRRAPEWPEGEDLKSILKKAFKGRVIRNLDHPVARELMGLEGLD